MMRLDPAHEEGACQNCGVHVTARFRAVYGDDDDVVHRCLSCDTFGRISEGSAAGLDVHKVDPIDVPNRNRGYRVGANVRADGGEFSDFE